ncbi:MAG TPA: 3,4-dihydroxy-2-butanone-4-phosphate synthase [Bryobacteraceae bacterium]
MAFASISEAIEDFRAGRMLVIVDDEDRENEGDVTVAAEKVTPDIINFMAKHARGLICLSLTPELCDELALPPMSAKNNARLGTAFTESIEAAEGVTTGISAADRAHTIAVAMDPSTKPGDLVRPGHVFPLRAREGGVLVRAGQTEAVVDLARLAGLRPGGVICEIMNDDGSMARVPQLIEFCGRHDLRMISVEDLIRYRLQNERFVRRESEGCLRTEFGDFKTIVYSSTIVSEMHLALIHGEVAGRENILVRMHSHCIYGDVFGSTECECRQMIRNSLERIAAEGAGVLVYLHQTGPGIRHHISSSTPDGQKQLLHESGLGAQILSDLGLHTIRLLTNHPRKVVGLDAYGIEIADQVPL